ncbi:thiamine-phosphate kinase [Paraneptunicella aestuarii]|uniref:thiamine-phosphate kinase n=1 Tax=Paraneptunicella aestuarii TaxID=2831148 RepID=UPI001E314ED8|nr:thiamine-phosphate kinase [Paraneptunicella aestuarii]UAA37543.1 thiamine-phosphate kinase [Paraneptunicella aestuarii]
MKEFDIIEHFFQPRSYQRHDVVIGIGDDCAVTNVPEGQHLVTTTDTLLEGVHFPVNTNAGDIAHKAVAVNLSDLAAMGAEPAWINLSLSLPKVDPDWLNDFSKRLQELTEYYSIQLIGGDTVQGPLAVTITAQGFLPKGQALTRSRAKPGDYIYVTGTLGDAALGLQLAMGKKDVQLIHRNYLLKRLNTPTPRVLAGTALRRIAHSCIDISDGVVSDLKHILFASQVGAVLNIDRLPFSEAMQESVSRDDAVRYALAGGDDYELLFTIPEEQKGNLDIVLANCNVSATCIGQLNGYAEKLELKDGDAVYSLEQEGFQHFA